MATNESRFADRLETATYGDDPLVGWFSADPPAEVWVPERLVDRLRLLGAAYELHLLPLLPGCEPIDLRRPQVTHLIEEIDWVAALTDDPALRRSPLTYARCFQPPRHGDGLWIEGN